MTDTHGNTAGRSDEELNELLIRRAIEPLAPVEHARLRQMLSDSPDADADMWDRAAAAVYLAAAPVPEEIPDSLRARLERAAPASIGGTSNRRDG